MTHYDDGAEIEWIRLQKGRPQMWSDIIDPNTIPGLIEIIRQGDKPGRMQTADGPECKDQFLRTVSGHAIKINQAMDSDQMYYNVSAEDWPRAVNRREFFHIGDDNTRIGADYGGLQPGLMKCLQGQNGRNVVNYTAGPNAETVRLAALNKLDHTKGKRAHKISFEKR